jgi:flagellar biosynthesis GTPase FlhF
MVLKTFTAPDLSTALALARAELGAGAFVLATRDVRTASGAAGVEVTVGANRGVADAVEPVALRRWIAGREGASVAEPSDPSAGPAHPEWLRETVAELVAAGVTPDLAERFARVAGSEAGARSRPHERRAAEDRALASILEFAPMPVRGSCLFLVGPPGAGKTTTAAKLAARLVLATGRRVVLAEADHERVGALAQASVYAEHIGAELVPVEGPGDLRVALNRAGRHGFTIVDTPGVGARDERRLDALVRLRGMAPRADLAVVLPAGLHRDEAAATLARFAPLSPTCAGFLRLDDGDHAGELVSALAGSGLPLAFTTDGHRVPDDLHAATPRGLAGWLLRSGRGTRPAEIRA